MRYRIAIDSGGEIPEALKGKEEFVLVPLTLMVGDETLTDDGTIDQGELIRKIAASPTCPKTACPSPEAYFKAFDAGAEHNYAITLSGELSGSYQSAVLGMNMFLEEYPDAKIHVFNAKSSSVGETVLLLKIREFEEAGLPFEEIVERVEKYNDEKNTFFVLDDLETLRKNGRLSRLKALAATMLKIKPICHGTKEGQIEQIDRARGTNKALVRMVELLVERTADPENRILGISYANCRERAVMVRDAVLARMRVASVELHPTGGLSTIYANDGGIIVVI